MACVNYENLCYMAGATVNIDFQVLEDDEVTPVDLAGATIELSLLNTLQDITSVEDFSGGITDAENGSGRFSLTKIQSQALLPIGNGDDSIAFKSTMKIEYADTTVDFLAGLDISFNQNASR
ncbi:MAG: hypothetical protein GY928_16375 [Colwellia sp.]|nr:hypothetical protein [Colwellia sp.]